MVLNQVYRKSPDIIASYNWEDLTARLGYINFYAGVFDNNGTEQERLVTQPFFSNSPDSKTTTPFEGAIMDRTFTIDFGITRTVEGEVVIQIPVEGGKGTAGAGNQTFTHKITIKKNITTIGSGTIKGVVPVPGSFVKAGGMCSGMIEVPRTNFSEGDTLSVKIASSNSGLSNTSWAGVSHEPSGTVKTGETYPTGALTIAVPFLLTDI